MSKKVKNLLRNNVVLCVLVLVVIGVASICFAADVKVQAGKVKPQGIKLPNDTYLTAKDYAGTGTVDLIKANTSDVAVIPDGSELATSAAPTADADIANKKYVDDQIAVAIDSILGSWTSLDSNSNTLAKDNVYKAGSDGFVVIVKNNVNEALGYTDNSSPPTTLRTICVGAGSKAGGTMPVKKDDYWKITTTSGVPTLYWIPIGNGSCVKQ